MRIDNRWPDGESFFRSLNKKGRNNHTRGKRILAELGGDVSFRFVEPAENASVLFDEIIRLKEAWLRVNDPKSPLLGPDGPVLRAILDQAWRSGIARIFLLECGGKVAAASINFVYAERMEAYFTAYDAAFDRASPGTILIVEYARWSFDRETPPCRFPARRRGFQVPDGQRRDVAQQFRRRSNSYGSGSSVWPSVVIAAPPAAGDRERPSR